MKKRHETREQAHRALQKRRLRIAEPFVIVFDFEKDLIEAELALQEKEDKATVQTEGSL